MVTTDQRPPPGGGGRDAFLATATVVSVVWLAAAELMVVLSAAYREVGFLIAGLTMAGGWLIGLSGVLMARHRKGG